VQQQVGFVLALIEAGLDTNSQESNFLPQTAGNRLN